MPRVLNFQRQILGDASIVKGMNGSCRINDIIT